MSSVSSDHIELIPSLKGVTVFSDRAQLAFVASTALECGTHIIHLRPEGNWEDMITNTLLVKVQDGSNRHVAVHDVRLKHTDLTEEVREGVRVLKDSIDELQGKIDAVTDKKKVQSAVEAAVEKIEKKLMIMGERDCPSRAHKQLTDTTAITLFLSQPSSWMELICFISGRKRHVRECLLELKDEETKLQASLSKLQEELGEMQRGKRRQRRNTTVEVTLTVREQPTELKLNVSFVVTGASWKPLYDMRVSSSASTMDLTYYAQVQQRTPIDWNKVQLKVSTAAPHFGTQPPKLATWRISLKPPIANLKPRLLAMNLRGMPMPCAARAVDTTDCNAAPREARVKQAIVSSSSPFSGAISSFHVLGLTTVRNNNRLVKVAIAKQTFPVELEYHAVPKSDKRVFRTAKAKNTSPYIFLPGKSHIFVDSTFMCGSRLDLVPAGADFSASLGADERVEVVRKEVKRTRSIVTRVVRSPLVRMDHVYEFSVKGTVQRETTLLVRDQCPLSPDDEVKVCVVEPSSKALKGRLTADGMKCAMDQMGMIEWKLKLSPGANNHVFRYAFQVEHPERLTVRGV
ncbi:N-terminal domain of unknown function (DUF4140)/Domain of unknown function (DUF4139), putative [Trypanosoma equiperdum]|uniref:DUF4139 domain-containing protein n=1 Tax=Trypanosoma equiperdum TaxID=5694 RepID=A0A1G4IHF9_TRYEQ|nr:N-terminal domain of unknown function (DUF4140)/Domain of unknown function (DUF4139), putative [Trypanosoma equiperdum]